MRIIFVCLLSCMILSCKTTNAISSDEVISFVVVLEKPFNPNALKKGIAVEISAFKDLDKNLNQYMIDFRGNSIQTNNLKAMLLNHHKVISVLTVAQFEKIKQKKGKKSVDGSQGKGGVSKQ